MFLSTLDLEACYTTAKEPLEAARPPPLHGLEAGGQDALKLDDDLDVGEAVASRRSSPEDLVLFFPLGA
ncbi:hypothetical protein TYRP_003976 [Tyrophagus putrescentiae]|nr:hypothetical protein TYRP_003976 [Tyrophagus putrescentiae]